MEKEGAEPRLRTIGSVCEELREQFPDISVSKIRYLEDQGLIAPKRTRGGYRLFAPGDIERLTTILRLQRDEFLPLRVIREELAGPGASAERTRRRAVGITDREDEIDEAELCERASVSPDFVRQLEEYGLVVARVEAGGAVCTGKARRTSRAPVRGSPDSASTDATCGPSSPGVGRQATLIEQLVAPGLRSRNAERRKNALDDLEALSKVAQELSHLLLLRDLRSTVERTS